MLSLKLSTLLIPFFPLPPTFALLSPGSSPCAVSCGNVLTGTASDELTCSQSFTSGNGAVFKSCVDCQVQSSYYDSDLSDIGAALYNIRYASAYCLFGKPSGQPLDSPCVTSTACGPLIDAFDFDNLTTSAPPYDYCSLWTSDQVIKCESCLSAASLNVFRNYITLLDTACTQLPTNGTPLSFTGEIFSTTPIIETTPNPLSTYTAASFIHDGLSLSVKVLISFAALLFLLCLLGTSTILLGRRRRRAYLRMLEKKPYVKWGGPASPVSPVVGGKVWKGVHGGWPGMGVVGRSWENGTPISQRGLRMWDESPVNGGVGWSSVGTPVSPVQGSFSPYVSPTDGMNMGATWEDGAVTGPEEQKQGEAREIGLAFEGRESNGESSGQGEEGIELVDVKRETPVLKMPTGDREPRTYEPESRS